MSDMVIFISPGKKAGFHAVGAFILVSNDKGSRGTEMGTEGKRRDRWERGERRGAAKTLKLWARLFKKPYIHENTNNRPLGPYVTGTGLIHGLGRVQLCNSLSTS